ARTGKRSLNCDLAQFMRRQVCERAVKCADRRARRTDNDDVVLHCRTPVGGPGPDRATACGRVVPGAEQTLFTACSPASSIARPRATANRPLHAMAGMVACTKRWLDGWKLPILKLS